MLLKKRQIITATLIIALCAAITVNWYFTKPENGTETQVTGSEEVVTGNLGDTLFVAGTTVKSDTTTNNQEETSAESVSSEEKNEEYFSQAKLKREKTYDETIDNIEQLISDNSVPDSEKNKISVMISDYQRDMKTQTDAENLITAKTGSECLVIINADSCQVILEKNTLNNTLAMQITEIIEKNTNIFSENLTIIELK